MLSGSLPAQAKQGLRRVCRSSDHLRAHPDWVAMFD
jgi:hypothetical protein